MEVRRGKTWVDERFALSAFVAQREVTEHLRRARDERNRVLSCIGYPKMSKGSETATTVGRHLEISRLSRTEKLFEVVDQLVTRLHRQILRHDRAGFPGTYTERDLDATLV